MSESQTDNRPTLIATPYMDTAGAELMSLSHRLATHPDFAGDADRLREIGAWVSMTRMQSDMERTLVFLLGDIVAAVRDRGVAFHEDQPIAEQFIAFLDGLPKPAPVAT